MSIRVLVNDIMKEISNIKELVELNNKFPIFASGIMEFYGPPFNVTVRNNSSYGITAEILTLILEADSMGPITALGTSSLYRNLNIQKAIELFLDLQHSGLLDDPAIANELKLSSSANSGSRYNPMPYVYNVGSKNFRKAAILLRLMELDRLDLLEKYGEYLTVKIPLEDYKKINRIRRELNELLAN